MVGWVVPKSRATAEKFPQFHNWVTADGNSGFAAEPDRYHLYISLGCPWAHRTAILRKLKGLEEVIGMSVVDPVISDRGWRFSDYPGCVRDRVYGADYLYELYVKAVSDYTGRVTVPVLWDEQTHKIINNESRQIIQMLNSEFDEFATQPQLDFYPVHLRAQIDEMCDRIYQPINNGVYRAGFATSPAAYEAARRELFAALDGLEVLLGQQPYLCGDVVTLADWCLFPTLFRFEPAYYGAFKCNLKHLQDYPHLWDYLQRLCAVPGVDAVSNVDHVKRLYYMGIPEIGD
jgi:glutathionyl-hydroquinone reductase